MTKLKSEYIALISICQFVEEIQSSLIGEMCLLQVSSSGKVLLCVPCFFRRSTVCSDEDGPSAAGIIL